MAYSHGANGELGTSIVTSVPESETLPLYIGTTPINLIRGYKDAKLTNKAIRLSDSSAKNLIGYSKNWSAFTLSAVISAHFENGAKNIGPIYIVNVLDPDLHRKKESKTIELSFANGRAMIESDTIILDTLAIEDKTEGTDYSVSYNFLTGKVVINSIDKENKITGVVSASYYEVDTDAVTKEDIIGEETEEGTYSGIQTAKTLYPNFDVYPSIIAAPYWSEKPAVYQALDEIVQSLNGHWYAMHFSDLPLVDEKGKIDTINKVIAWKEENGYESTFSKIFWPQAKKNSGEIYPLSILAICEQMRIDAIHEGVPMETCSNKNINVDTFYFGEESKNEGYDQTKANSLNENGITTMARWGGEYVLWGPHTAAFKAGKDGNADKNTDMLAIFDVNVRMQEYILNTFQTKWGERVDEPAIPQSLIDTILDQEQEKLDTLAAIGALVGEPKIEFLASNNSSENLKNGNFQWNFRDTPTPPAKSLKAVVSMTDEGYSTYVETEV